MRRGALLTAAILCAVLAAPAGAWVETATYDVPGGGIADCLRAAGPGQLALLGPLGRTITPMALLGVGAGGASLTPTGSVDLGWLSTCPEVTSADGAPPLFAAPAVDPSHPLSGETMLAVGGPGAALSTVPVPAAASLDSVVLATAPGGAAVVAWQEDSASMDVTRVLAAVRPPGQTAFGPATVLDRAASFERGAPAVGIDAAGRAMVAWAHTQFLGGGQENDTARVASAEPGAGFGAPQQLSTVFAPRLALAVAPDGRALLAVGDFDAVHAYERAAGAASFAPLPLPRVGAQDVAVALDPDGGALIGVRRDDRAVSALTRVPGGSFRAATPIPPERSGGGSSTVFVYSRTYGGHPSPPSDDDAGALTAALRPDGRALLTWVDDAHGGTAASARVAAGTLAGGFGAPSRLGSPCRPAAAARPLVLADGSLGVAFSDNARTQLFATDDEPLGDGEAHLAVPGAPLATAAPALRLTAQLVSTRPLGPDEPLRVRVHCSARCDVRMTAAARSVPPPRWLHAFGGIGTIALGMSTTASAGHDAILATQAFSGLDAAGVRGAPRAPIVVSACTPDGPLAARVRLAPPPVRILPPLPRVIHLVARRTGRAVRVTWGTTLPAREVRFSVEAVGAGDRRLARAQTAGRGHTRFALTLHPAHGARARSVVLDLESPQLFVGAQFSTYVR